MFDVNTTYVIIVLKKRISNRTCHKLRSANLYIIHTIVESRYRAIILLRGTRLAYQLLFPLSITHWQGRAIMIASMQRVYRSDDIVESILMQR